MKRSRIFSFAAGVATSVLFFACITGALAASGEISFNSAKIYLGGTMLAEEGQNLQTTAGAEIPSTIVYTDANGGDTLYVPIRHLTEALGYDVVWLGEENTASVFITHNNAMIYTMSSEFTIGLTVENIKEIEPVSPVGGTTVLPVTEHISRENFTYEIPFDPTKGEYMTVTVKNNLSAPIQFSWGVLNPSPTITGEEPSVHMNTAAVMPKQVRGESTMVRTFQVVGTEDMQALYLNIGNVTDMCELRSFEVSVVQFSE